MISNKFKWVIGLSLVFVLILTTNVIDRNNFKRIKQSIVTIYEDRLIAKDFIYRLSLQLEKKSLALASKDTLYFDGENDQVNDHINKIIDQFRETKLTTKEAQTLERFATDFEKLKTMEATKETQTEPLKNQISRLKGDLNVLSEIQLSEGKKQLQIGAKAADSVELLTKLEIIMLIILATLVQLLLLYTPKKES